MLDRYWYGRTSRISPEAPVPIVHVTHRDDRPGGAGNVAINAASLGATVTLLGLTGNDEAATILESLLTNYKINCHLIPVANTATITKLRIISQHQQLIRLDSEDDFTSSHSEELLSTYKSILKNKPVVIISDYGKGTVSDPRSLIALGRKANIPILIDPKGSDFSRYYGASILTPNLAEFEAVVGRCSDEDILIRKGEKLRQTLALESLLITRGEQGMTLLQKESPSLHLPAKAREVFDVTGAGDTVISVLATALAAGNTIKEATILANLAAGIVVGKLGTTHVTIDELQMTLHPPATDHRGIVKEEDLRHLMTLARDRGERIVMTNGCFDILHAGHVRYLAEARKLGDRLIVAVNDDNSVKHLKGKDRPINNLIQRMAVLASLYDVDWVIPFSEDTPTRLIEKILPDILVKGGDYTLAQIAGAETVMANGGEVVVLNYLEGHSTTRIIDTIRNSKEIFS
ncbi:bifunctional heptose 7-phosphate kinase/heptose 1-phosphate adenyltransferase [Candidatus Nitrosoglobus terrae]|uniref:Bifunctional protein HldE n=2 Tax=Candidatus Nitrosoglobus terrae TaxID=1630141 RepID=A0A1Q2SKQ0_9GAMM|nr:bifunctional heptose 7-phosphate kinase/heptose 1-phosphate adenyltransferase [Candidatus Nitrosoglobus terrae]